MKTAKLREFQSLAITGGAGFVGSNLACSLRRRLPQVTVTAFDNLKRRGSELNLPRLRDSSVEFVHGDIRCPDDLAELPDFDLLIDCSAEPSVHAGTKGSPYCVLDSNLTGTIHCLEAARERQAAFLFLSTSRVYPIASMNAIPFVEDETRFRWTAQDAAIPGLSQRGIGEDYPVSGARSFYGASKLACELLIQEYVESYAMPAIINRCGILAGPRQIGKVDQGVVSLWVARHSFGLPLDYIGFGGQGKQVRDLLHVDDLFDLIVLQMAAPEAWDGRVYNVGDAARSLSRCSSLPSSAAARQAARCRSEASPRLRRSTSHLPERHAESRGGFPLEAEAVAGADRPRHQVLDRRESREPDEGLSLRRCRIIGVSRTKGGALSWVFCERTTRRSGYGGPCRCAS